MLLVYWECNEDEEGREAQNYVVTAKEKHVDLAEYLPRYIIDGLQGIGARRRTSSLFPVAMES